MIELTLLDCIVGIIVALVATSVLFALIRGAIKNWEDTAPTPRRNMEPWLQHKMEVIRLNTPGWFADKLWNGVCPNCDRKMNSRFYGDTKQFSDHWCNRCGFITILEVLS